MGALDTSVMVVPFLLILVMGMFGLDERFASPRRPIRRRFFCEVERNGNGFLSDPDGKPWHKPPVRQIEARLVQAGPDGRLESTLRHRPS